MSLRTALFAWVCAMLWAGCGAVYPELKTPMVAAGARDLDPAPSDMRWIGFLGATVPTETRDGRKWDATGNAAPDPYAVLLLNGKVVIKTPVQSNTTSPTWPGAPAGNFHIGPRDHFRVELWDSNPLTDHPIGVKDNVSLTDESISNGKLEIAFSTGAEIVVGVEPPRARWGLGLFYELRVGEAYVTRVYEQSPASRAGIKAGDQMLELGGRPVADMKAADVQSILNKPHLEGLPIKLRHKDGSEITLEIKDGAIYPLYEEVGTIR
jgi:PDZ domain/C2 domain